MEEMNEIQKTALEFWLKAVEFENEFKPNSDLKVSEYMKSIGHTISKSGIFKWREKFKWADEKEFRIKQMTSDDKKIRASIVGAAKDEALAKTLSDLQRNKALLGKSMAILEIKCKLIMEEFKITGKLTKDDVKLAMQIVTITANREDRLLDRKVVSEALGRKEALAAIAAVAGAVGFDGEEEFNKDEFEMGEIIDVKFEDEDEFEDD